MISQNSQNKAATANNETQQAAQVANSAAARAEAQKMMQPWLAPGAGPAAGMNPGHPVGVGGVPMGGGAPGAPHNALPGQRSPQSIAQSVMGQPPPAAPGAPPAPAQPPAAAPTPTPVPQAGGGGRMTQGGQGAAVSQGLSPAQIALFHHIFPQRGAA